MKSLTLEEVIRQYILPTDTSAKTKWHNVLCRICNDHGRKGKRAGFRFENQAVTYHCFNCGHATNYDPSLHKTIPKKMLVVLEAFNVPKEEYKQVVFSTFGKTLNRQVKQKSPLVEPTIISLPSTFSLLDTSKSRWAEVAKEYLLYERGIEHTSYPFMIGTHLKDWIGRLIIPIYKDNNLIYYQGRDITFSDERDRYLSPPVEKNKILYGFNLLHEDIGTPLFIVEGFFDAFLIDGVALLGKEISSFQQAWLESSPREKVYIPDRQQTGLAIGVQALRLGWYISTPGLTENIVDCGDINDMFKRYGKLFVIKSIMDHKCKGLKAKINLKQYCKG